MGDYKMSKRLKEKLKQGISLITLVITVIVIIILASAVIISISDNNPINTAKQALFKNDLDTFRTDLELYHNSQYIKNNGDYNQSDLQADTDTIGDTIESLRDNDKYKNKLKIEEGELIFICTGTVEDEWAKQIGIKTTCDDDNPGDDEPSNIVMSDSNITQDPEEWTNGDVKVEVSYPDGIEIKQFKIGDANWETYEDWIIVAQNTIVYARGIDYSNRATNTVQKTVTNIDKVSPTITLNGAETISINIGEAYNEQSATASDDSSGIDESGVRITGSVDTNTSGTYIKTYSVSDNATNTAEITRTVNVNVPVAPTSWQFFQIITTTTNWTVPNTGWYKVNVIGKGGNGGKGGNSGARYNGSYSSGYGAGGGGRRWSSYLNIIFNPGNSNTRYCIIHTN